MVAIPYQTWPVATRILAVGVNKRTDDRRSSFAGPLPRGELIVGLENIQKRKWGELARAVNTCVAQGMSRMVFRRVACLAGCFQRAVQCLSVCLVLHRERGTIAI